MNLYGQLCRGSSALVGQRRKVSLKKGRVEVMRLSNNECVCKESVK